LGIGIIALISGWILVLAQRWIPPSGTDILKFIGFIMFIILFVSTVLYQLFFVFIPLLKPLFKPTDTCLERMQKAAGTEMELIKTLADAELPALEQTIEKIDYEVSSLESRVNAFTGGLQKLGIVPPAVILCIAFAKKEIPEGQFILKHMDYVFYGALTIYFAALIACNTIDRLRLFSIIIKAAKDKAEYRSALQSPNLKP